MAGNGDTNGNLKAHEATYHSVIGLLKYGAVACFVIALLVIYLIAGR